MSIIVADDDADLRALVSFTLTHGGFQVIAVSDGTAAIAAFEREEPELIVLDINLPDRSGYEVCRAVRQRASTPIVMLSARHEEEYVVTAFDCGADGYLTKPFSPRTLLARTRALLRRAQGYSVPAELTAGSIKLLVRDHLLRIAQHEIRLTSLEVRLVQLLMSSPARTITQERLLENIWGGSGARERNALKQLVYRLRQKVEVEATEPTVLQTTPGSGYRLVPP